MDNYQAGEVRSTRTCQAAKVSSSLALAWACRTCPAVTRVDSLFLDEGSGTWTSAGYRAGYPGRPAADGKRRHHLPRLAPKERIHADRGAAADGGAEPDSRPGLQRGGLRGKCPVAGAARDRTAP